MQTNLYLKSMLHYHWTLAVTHFEKRDPRMNSEALMALVAPCPSLSHVSDTHQLLQGPRHVFTFTSLTDHSPALTTITPPKLLGLYYTNNGCSSHASYLNTHKQINFKMA